VANRRKLLSEGGSNEELSRRELKFSELVKGDEKAATMSILHQYVGVSVGAYAGVALRVLLGYCSTSLIDAAGGSQDGGAALLDRLGASFLLANCIGSTVMGLLSCEVSAACWRRTARNRSRAHHLRHCLRLQRSVVWPPLASHRSWP
jgi:hypothetical protein